MTHIDDLLFAMIIAGIGLSVAYLRAELVVHQEFKAAEREKALALRGTSQDCALNTLPCSGNRVRLPGRFKQILSSL